MVSPKVRWPLAALVAAFALVAACSDDSPEAPSLDGPRPSTLQVETIGTSVQGRAIQAVSLGTGDHIVLVVGGLHTGEEQVASDLAEQMARYIGEHVNELPAGVHLVFVPRVNPDGYADGTRLNANGVDLNRNWPTADWVSETTHGEELVSGGPAPLSEPETAALHTFIDTLAPTVVISLHCCASLVEPNESGPAVPLATAYANATDYQFIEQWPYYEITGELIEAMNDLHTAAFDVELAQGATDSFEKNLAGLKAVLKAIAQAGAG